MMRRYADDNGCNGAGGDSEGSAEQRRRDFQAQANFRRKRRQWRNSGGGGANSSLSTSTTTSYRRWSSRRRISHHRLRRSIASSRLPSDELEELALMQQQQQQTSSSSFSLESCVHCLPLRPHVLCVAAFTFVVSLSGLVACVTLLLRAAVLREIAALPPGCTGHTRVRKEREKRKDLFLEGFFLYAASHNFF